MSSTYASHRTGILHDTHKIPAKSRTPSSVNKEDPPFNQRNSVSRMHENIESPHTPKTGYLASTFGTLLSSQGTDAHRPPPLSGSRGNPSNLDRQFVRVKSVYLICFGLFARPKLRGLALL